MQRPAQSRPFPVSDEQYLKMGELGFFEGRRVELVKGTVIEMAAMNHSHWIATAKTTRLLNQVFKEPYFVLSQLPLKIDQFSEPEPDVFVVQIESGNFDALSKANALSMTQLVIEISDTTLREDRTTKARLYAQAGIIEYWIVNVADRQLEVRRNPTKKGYSSTQTLKEADEVSPLSAPNANVKIADLLP